MKLNQTYIIRVTINNHLLTYIGKIISIDELFITFKDKNNKEISINKKNIESYEELK